MSEPIDTGLPDDAVPTEEGPTRLQARRPGSAREIVRESDLANADLVSPASITGMMRTVHPFFSYFEYVASTHYPQKRSDAARVQQLRTDHGRLYWTCIVLDILLILVPLSLLLVGSVGLVAYKTLWP